MKKLATTLGVGVLLTAAGLATAQSHPADVKLPKEIQDMHCLIGNWQGTATFAAGDTKSDVKVSWACKPTSLGYGVSCLARFAGMPGGAQEENDLFGFDPGARKYHWFSVTSMGETHDHVAEMPGAGSLRFVYDGVSEGQALQETIVLSIDEQGKHMKLDNVGTVGGKHAWTLSGNATKK